MDPVDSVAQGITVEVVQALGPRQLRCVSVRLPAGAVVSEACSAAARAWGVASDNLLCAPLAVWGRKARAAQALREGDRVEILRSLQVDPKEARRQRYRAQGERGRAPRQRVRRTATS